MSDAAADITLWSLASGIAGFVAKSLWDSYRGYRDNVRMETWKIRTNELERRLSEFYWPLYMCLQRDDIIWRKVFYDLDAASGRPTPEWAARLPEEERRRLAGDIEAKVLLPNHVQAIGIIRSAIHLANADTAFEQKLALYVKHVDVYISLRSAGSGLNPIHVGEPYPEGLMEAVRKRLLRYQTEYESLLRDRDVLDLSRLNIVDRPETDITTPISVNQTPGS